MLASADSTRVCHRPLNTRRALGYEPNRRVHACPRLVLVPDRALAQMWACSPEGAGVILTRMKGSTGLLLLCLSLVSCTSSGPGQESSTPAVKDEPAASVPSPTKVGPLVDETAMVPPVLPDTINGQAKQPTDQGSNFTDGQASPGSDCCIGARYGEDQGISTYVLVLLRRPIDQALTPSDALRKFLGGNASDTHVAMVGDVAYSCSQVKTVDPSEPVTGSCIWADEILFGTLEFFDSTDPPAMWSLTAKVQQEVAGLNQSS